RDAREELEQCRVRDRALQLRIHFRVDGARIEEAIDEPRRRAVREALELGDVERLPRAELLEDERVRQLGRPAEGKDGALEPAVPAVRARERLGAGTVHGSELRERAEAFTLGRRLV